MKPFHYFLPLIFLISGFNSLFGQELKSYDLSERVKSFRQIGYDVVSDTTGIKRGNKLNWYVIEDILVTFDSSGNESEKIEYKLDGSISERFISRRDSTGKLLEYSGHGRWNFVEKYKYNEFGQLFEKIHYYSDGSVKTTTKYKYNEIGELVESDEYQFDGSIHPKIIYKSGQRIESICYLSDGTIREDTKFNKYGNVIENTVYNSDGSIKVKMVNNPVDENGNEIDNNDLLKPVYEYTYDFKKNWVKRIHYRNKIPKYWIERVIEYYD